MEGLFWVVNHFHIARIFTIEINPIFLSICQTFNLVKYRSLRALKRILHAKNIILAIHDDKNNIFSLDMLKRKNECEIVIMNLNATMCV